MDQERFAQVLEQLEPALRKTISIPRRYSTTLEVDDILQVTFLEAFCQFKSLRAESEPQIFVWLKKAALNNQRDAIRALQSQKRPDSRRRTQSPSDSEQRDQDFLANIRSTTSTPSRGAVRDERAALLRGAIARLPKSYADVLHGILEGESIEQIAARQERTVGAVHMLRHRAVCRLRELLPAASFSSYVSDHSART